MADNRNRANVIVGAPDLEGVGGAALIGDPITNANDIPTSAVSELSDAINIQAVGFIGEDGITKAVEREIETIPDWNGDTVATIQSSHAVTLQLQFLEGANIAVLKAIHGDNNVTVSGDSITITDNADETPQRSYIFNIDGGNGRKVRVVAPDAKVTEQGDTVYNRSDVVRYDVTLDCRSDSQGNKLYVFVDAPTVPTNGAASASLPAPKSTK